MPLFNRIRHEERERILNKLVKQKQRLIEILVKFIIF